MNECVKVKKLREKNKFKNLREWMDCKDNLYVGRRGRIFIDKKIFHYKQSKWHNPYKNMEITLSLSKYITHLIDSNLIKDLHELKGKNLGCFCENTTECHAYILVCLLNEQLLLEEK